jgi:Kazal-type serine protease inhibitor-like protein
MWKTIVLIAMLAACGGKTASPPPPSPTGGGTEGSGATPPKTEEGPICGTRGAAPCPDGQFCSFAPGADCGATDKPGHCMAKPAACPRIAQPVCGCDGKTYGNGCEAAAAQVGVRATGACAK